MKDFYVNSCIIHVNYEKLLEIKRKLFGSNEHSSIALTLIEFANVNKKLERYKEAYIHFESALSICKKVGHENLIPYISFLFLNGFGLQMNFVFYIDFEVVIKMERF